MIAIVASRLDTEAAALATRWVADGAALLTCDDLSTSGWRHFPDDLRSSAAVIDGAVVPISRIRGVLTRRPQIFEAELVRVAAEDREYVAAEMNAFLICWLAFLPCPVINPPTPGCLSGPNWTPQQWVHAAARLGIRVRPIPVCVPARSAPTVVGSLEPLGEIVEATVVDEHCFGAPDEVVATCARRLAAAAAVRFLSVRFEIGTDPPVFRSAVPFPKLTDNSVVDAIRESLLSGDSPETHNAWGRP